MTPREIGLTRLSEQARSLVTDRTVVVATPLPGDLFWAVDAVWQLARAIAQSGRRVALVDLSLDKPVLHAAAAEQQETGIVDAFLFGASLQHVTAPQDVPGLHFIGAGSRAPDAEEIWGSPRWRRLAKGFSNQSAVLLLFLPPRALTKLALEPDLVVAFASDGAPDEGAEPVPIRTILERGSPVTFVVPQTAPEPLRPTPPRSVIVPPREYARGRPRPRRWRVIGLAALGVVVTGAVAAAVLLVSDGSDSSVARESVAMPTEADRDEPMTQATEAPVDTQTAVDSAPTGPLATDSISGGIDAQGAVDPQAAAGETPRPQTEAPVGPTDESDSLYYSVQVAAFTRLDDAATHADAYVTGGFSATISAVRDARGSIWYRVLVGSATSPAAAAAMRSELRSAGLLEPTVGLLLRTPHALYVQAAEDSTAAAEAHRGLRQSGLPTYILEMPDGSYGLFLGAFETIEQALLTDSVLTASQFTRPRTPVTRVGIAR
jgi:cell division septation protein DedD